MENMTDCLGSQPLKIHQELSRIENTLQNPVSPKTCHRVFRQLNATSSSLHNLQSHTSKTTSLFQKAQQEHLLDLQERIVTLYGKAVDRKIDFQIEQIAKEATELEQMLDSASPEAVDKESKLLQKHVSALLHDHRLSQSQLPIVNRAKDILSLAQSKISGKASSTPRHFDWLASQPHSIQGVQEAVDLLPGEVEELFEIATLIASGGNKQAKLRFNLLPEDIKSRAMHHSNALKGALFEENGTTTKALIATAYELAGIVNMYLSDAEIRVLFQDVMHIKAEERQEPVKSSRFIG